MIKKEEKNHTLTRFVLRMWRKALASVHCPIHGSPTKFQILIFDLNFLNFYILFSKF